MEDNRGFPCFELDCVEEDLNEESDEDWSARCSYGTKRPGDCDQNSPAKKKLKAQLLSPEPNQINTENLKPSDDILISVKGHERTIIHIDIDCFYAQVEMILNPSLHNKPLGIQQKHIVVTCNYVARERGLTKLMRLSEAKKQCPELILINGEDLTKYRDFSKRVNELLLGITSSVERLGLDENFLDVSGLVESRMKGNIDNMNPVGFVYGADNQMCINKEHCSCGCHDRLTIGSILASEIRERIFEQIGLTCCAGIAHNKILAKLVGECHKPNKQTVLFPEDANSFMQSLPARKIPGIGSSSAKRLQSIGITTVLQLQSCSLETIQMEFGDGPLAMNLKRLSFGVDDTSVIASGSPKSISEEDTYHNCSTIKDVTQKLKGLNDKLVSRLKHDLGIPQTLRLTIRRGIGELAGDRKESRQCPLPAKFGSPGLTTVNKTEILLNITMELFKKLVNIKQPFNIKLLNVCLTKFQKSATKGKTSLTSFFLNCKDETKCKDSQGLSGQSSLIEETGLFSQSSGIRNQENVIKDPIQAPLASKHTPVQVFKQTSSSCKTENADKELNDFQMPSTVDKDIFNALPVELQKELMQEWKIEQNHSSKKMKNQKPTSSTGLFKYFSKK